MAVLLTTTKRGKQITGSKTVKSKKKTKREKSLDAICANFMEVPQADVKRQFQYKLIEVLRYCDNYINKTKIVLYRLGEVR